VRWVKIRKASFSLSKVNVEAFHANPRSMHFSIKVSSTGFVYSPGRHWISGEQRLRSLSRRRQRVWWGTIGEPWRGRRYAGISVNRRCEVVAAVAQRVNPMQRPVSIWCKWYSRDTLV